MTTVTQKVQNQYTGVHSLTDGTVKWTNTKIHHIQHHCTALLPTIAGYQLQGGTAIRGGQRFADFYCTSIKTNICVDTEGAL